MSNLRLNALYEALRNRICDCAMFDKGKPKRWCNVCTLGDDLVFGEPKNEAGGINQTC
jgi:hypothetical protein